MKTNFIINKKHNNFFQNYSNSLKISLEIYLLKIYLLQEFIFKVYKYLKAYFKILSRTKNRPNIKYIYSLRKIRKQNRIKQF